MSTLRVTNISNAGGTKTVPADTVVDGTAKAWVSFNGTGTVAIRASFNVTSITDNGTGDYTINFTTALTDANYSLVLGARNNNAGSVRCIGLYSGGAYSTTQARLFVVDSVAGAADPDIVNAAAYR